MLWNYLRGPVFLLMIFFGLAIQSNTCFAQKWYQSYQMGVDAMERSEWQPAITHFKKALQVKKSDSHRIRASGAMLIEYYPHRELGICYLKTGQNDLAMQELSLSIQQAESDRAKEHMQMLGSTSGIEPDLERADQQVIADPPPLEPDVPAKTTVVPAGHMSGERMGIAVLPFVTQGMSDDFTNFDLLDKLITGFVNTSRFRVIERAQLTKVLDEQKLGLSGIVDPSTAAQIGRGIGVDAVVCGSVTRGRRSYSIDARFIDTETAGIITAREAFSNGSSLQGISRMISDLAVLLKNDLPIVSGYVIKVDGDKITLDLGQRNGIRKGMKCRIFREGEPIVHPVSGAELGRSIEELCDVQITDVYSGFSISKITKTKLGTPKVTDRVITK